MTHHFRLDYKMSEQFDTIKRLTIGYPVVMSLIYWVLVNNTDIFEKGSYLKIVGASSLALFVIALLLRYFGLKYINPDDVFVFYVSDERVVSEYPVSDFHSFKYDIEIEKITQLVISTGKQVDQGITSFWLKVDNKSYQLPDSYLSPLEVFDAIRKVRPELEVRTIYSTL